MKVFVPSKHVTTQLVKGRRRFDIDSSYILAPGTVDELVVESALNEHICDGCETKEKSYRKVNLKPILPNKYAMPPSLVLNSLEF